MNGQERAWATVGSVAVIALCLTMGTCGVKQQGESTKRVTACVNNGGSWVSEGNCIGAEQ